jgi:hypothetical protein
MQDGVDLKDRQLKWVPDSDVCRIVGSVGVWTLPPVERTIVALAIVHGDGAMRVLHLGDRESEAA